MEIDPQLLAYARDQLLRTTAASERAQVDAFLHSTTFSHLAGGFNKILEQAMHAFHGEPDRGPALQPLPLKDLATPAATEPIASAAPDAPVAPERPLSLLPDIGFRLPNARAGAAYRQPLEAIPVSEDKVCFCALVSTPGVALEVDNATGLVTGTPATPGAHALHVTYHYATEPGQLRHATVTLTVAP